MPQTRARNDELKIEKKDLFSIFKSHFSMWKWHKQNQSQRVRARNTSRSAPVSPAAAPTPSAG